MLCGQRYYECAADSCDFLDMKDPEKIPPNSRTRYMSLDQNKKEYQKTECKKDTAALCG